MRHLHAALSDGSRTGRLPRGAGDAGSGWYEPSLGWLEAERSSPGRRMSRPKPRRSRPTRHLCRACLPRSPRPFTASRRMPPASWRSCSTCRAFRRGSRWSIDGQPLVQSDRRETAGDGNRCQHSRGGCLPRGAKSGRHGSLRDRGRLVPVGTRISDGPDQFSGNAPLGTGDFFGTGAPPTSSPRMESISETAMEPSRARPSTARSLSPVGP